MGDIRITVWNEYQHEKANEFVGGIYPDGIHGAIAEGLRQHGFDAVRTATLDEPQHGLTEEVLAETDVLTWWGHRAHAQVSDEVVERVQSRVLQGMGLIVLHSGHFSKIFRKLMGTTCSIHWREADERERIWVVKPSHPISRTACRPSSSTKSVKCTVSFSTFQPPTISCLSAGSRVAMCFAAGRASTAATARSSISDRAMRPTRYSNSRSSAR